MKLVLLAAVLSVCMLMSSAHPSQRQRQRQDVCKLKNLMLARCMHSITHAEIYHGLTIIIIMHKSFDLYIFLIILLGIIVNYTMHDAIITIHVHSLNVL